MSGVLGASGDRVASLEERIARADRVVVAVARSVIAEWRQNRHGDRLIVSRILLEVDETLKGGVGRMVWLDVDGGTLDGLTLRVSSLPMVHPGDRAVFFLDHVQGNVHTPHRRGQGILMLDDRNVVRGSTVGLDEIRTKARRVGGQGQ